MRKGFLKLLALSLAFSPAFAAEYKAGEVVVKLKTGRGILSTSQQSHLLLTELGDKYALTVKQLETDHSFAKVKVDGDVPMAKLLDDVRHNDQVEYAEPNFIYRVLKLADDAIEAVLPNDPNFGQNWGLLNTGQKDSKGQPGIAGADIGATKAWARGTGSKSVVVAVIDTGIDYNHEELKDNMYVNTKEIAGNGKDDDGNGFIDDVRGWNFEGKNNDPMDDNRHGTHCAGTIGAKGNNGVGTAGVNWSVSLVPVKFLSASGSGTLDDALESIKYATKLGVNIMSNSWGGGGFSQGMFDAIKDARDKGILFVAAAGNDGNDNDAHPSYPATYDSANVISVAATDNRDQKSSWSNYGQTKVHLAAPGVNVYSTVPTDKGGYDTLSGTSMACPHVAGAAALLWSLNPKMTYADIKGRLLATVDPVRGLKRKVASGGRLNIYNALTNTVPPRSEPPKGAWKSVAKSIESVHPYVSNTNVTYEISHPGARFIRVHFTRVGTEAGYDFVHVKGADGSVADEITGEKSDYTSDYIEGDKAVVTLNSDGSVDGWGFAVDRYEFID